MERVDDDKWLDEALDGALHSDDTQPDFEAWKARHPEAVETLTTRTPQPQQPPATETIRIGPWFVKLAAAAVIVIAAIIGVTQLTRQKAAQPKIRFSNGADLLVGPATHTFGDGSIVKLTAGASVRTYSDVYKRGFEHVSGVIDVTVAKGLGEFIVTTPYGDVKALGTEFTLELVDGTAESGEKVELLSVEVTEGKVEVSNARGKTTLEASQDTIVAKDAAPYDFSQDEALSDRLKERIEAMVAAFEGGDAAAWAANFNINYLFKLAKGQVEYDPLLFGGSQEDAQRLGERLKDIESPEQLGQVFIGTVNITESITVYVRSVELSDDGKHAQAECVRRRGPSHMVITRPQWHHFDNDWWQIDD
ncbi:MAG: FecR domain-containing protein [Phycisphaerales bacterium]|nr:MAG: FecR domain-containing protein [Phycisphaerales bacterium]